MKRVSRWLGFSVFLAVLGAVGGITSCETPAAETKPPTNGEEEVEEPLEEEIEFKTDDAAVYALNGFVKYVGEGVLRVKLNATTTEAITVGRVEKGRLTLELPELRDEQLSDLDEWEATERGVYIGQNGLTLYEEASGYKLGELRCLKREYSSLQAAATTVMFLYAGEDMVIQNTQTQDDAVNEDFETVPLTRTLDVSAKRGWNTLVFKSVSSLSGIEESYWTVEADGLTGVKWLLDVSAAAKTSEKDWETAVVYDSASKKTRILGVPPLKEGGGVVPATVTEIGDYAFAGCAKLTGVTTTEGALRIIGSYAFQGCRRFTSVAIPDSVTSIGSRAFAELDLVSVTIGKEAAQETVIGDHAFYKCVSLRNVEIAAGVKSIERYAFADCLALKSVTIPASVTSIGAKAFLSATTTVLTQVTFLGENTEFEENSFPAATAADKKLKDVYETGGEGTYELKSDSAKTWWEKTA